MTEFKSSEAIGRYIMRNGRVGELIRVETETETFEGVLRDTGDSMEPGDVISATCEVTGSEDVVSLYAEILSHGDMEMEFDVFAIRKSEDGEQSELGEIQHITPLD